MLPSLPGVGVSRSRGLPWHRPFPVFPISLKPVLLLVGEGASQREGGEVAHQTNDSTPKNPYIPPLFENQKTAACLASRPSTVPCRLVA